MRAAQTLSLSLALILLIAWAPVFADDPCAGFKWDVSAERTLFAASPVGQKAGVEAKSAPSLPLKRLLEIQLVPEQQVVFAAMPGKKQSPNPSYGGLLALKVSVAGSYRVSLDTPLWIDVVDHGQLVRARDYAGQEGCSAPHKIVVFDLNADEPLLLQLSGAAQATVRLTVTQAAAE